jgi:tetratricopeptide (TPR) repeat protein
VTTLSDPSASEIARLEKRAAADPALLPQLAEAHRHAGRPDEAERVARRGLKVDPHSLRLHVALALALLDLRRADGARDVLERALRSGPAHAAGVSEQELEDAFARAEPDLDQVVDADRVAERALREAEVEPSDEIEPVPPDSPFATRTMADLLERQGDRAGAARIRSGLERPRAAQPAPAPDPRRRVVKELERWLANLRKEA